MGHVHESRVKPGRALHERWEEAAEVFRELACCRAGMGGWCGGVRGEHLTSGVRPWVDCWQVTSPLGACFITCKWECPSCLTGLVRLNSTVRVRAHCLARPKEVLSTWLLRLRPSSRGLRGLLADLPLPCQFLVASQSGRPNALTVLFSCRSLWASHKLRLLGCPLQRGLWRPGQPHIQ